MNQDFLILVILLSGMFIIISIYMSRYLKVYDDPLLQRIYLDLKKVYPDIDSKNIKLYGANNTLTENKKKIFLCLKKKNGEYYDYNTLLYLAIHELAHVINNEYDTGHNHGEKFNELNDILLTRAYDKGLLDKNKEIEYDMCGRM
jgi:hypothetical protein